MKRTKTYPALWPEQADLFHDYLNGTGEELIGPEKSDAEAESNGPSITEKIVDRARTVKKDISQIVTQNPDRYSESKP